MSEPRLPRGWRWVTIAEMAIVDPRDPLPNWEDDLPVPFVPMSAIDEHSGTLSILETKAYKECRQGKTRFQNGDVLFAKITPCVENGKVARVDSLNFPMGFGSTEFFVLRPHQQLIPQFLWFFLRQPKFRELAIGSMTGTSGRQRIPGSFWSSAKIPLPPLPVQERIVEILQKADSIRRKRQEALGLADAVLSAAFMEMFGDPRENPREFKVTPLAELADVRSGVTKGRQLKGKETVEVPYLRVANVQDGYLDLSEVRTIEVLPQDVEKYHLEDGDILMIEGCGNPNYLGRGCIWQNQIPGCIHQNHIFRVRTHRERLLPECLASLLRTQYANAYFLSCAKNSSGLSNINSTQVKAFPVPEPPLLLQQDFVATVEQWEQINRRLTDGLTKSKRLFQGLMQQAFTGELMAAWEAEHAYEIAAEQARRERLPRLVLLDFVRERQQRRPTEPVLITSLMKYVFLLQQEGTTGQALCHFVPYKYGPFAKELYQDLQALVAEGFVAVTETDDERTEISLIPSKEPTLQKALADLAENFRTDVARILDQYGNLSHNQLLATVYERFPAYATESRLRRRRSP